MLDTPLRRREQEVWQALDELWAIHGDFKYLTGDAIRERLWALGKSRGSPNEIYKYRKTWAESHKISSGDRDVGFSLDDPITRAARLVHDEITQKAQEQIEKIKSDFIQKEEKYQKDFLSIKSSLDSLLFEYNNLEKNYTQTKLEFLEEKEMRKTLELAFESEKQRFADFSQEKANHILQLKNNSEGQIREIKDIFEKNILEKNNIINKLEEEKKILGIEYSENLNQVKTDNYNLKILIAKQEDKISLLYSDIDTHKQNIQEKNNIILEKEKHIVIEITKKEILQKELLEYKIELKQERYLVKSSETKLARLRALNLCYE